MAALNELDVCNLNCSNYKQCNRLHLCRQFLYSGCCQYASTGRDESCRFGHDIKSGHNLSVLERAGLHGLSIEELRDRLMSSKKNMKVIPICEDYLKGKAHDPNDCPALHVCYDYLFRSCGEQCKLSHDLLKLNCPTVLKYYGITLTEENARSILEDFSNQTRTQSGMSRFYCDYQNRSKIGSGSFGTVYKAKHITDKQTYAVKHIPFNRKDTDKVKMEAQISASLQHPNIVQYNTCWIDDEGPADETERNSSYHNYEIADAAQSTMGVQVVDMKIQAIPVQGTGCHCEQDKKTTADDSEASGSDVCKAASELGIVLRKQEHLKLETDMTCKENNAIKCGYLEEEEFSSSSCQKHEELESHFSTDERASEPVDDMSLSQPFLSNRSLYIKMELCDMDLSIFLHEEKEPTEKQLITMCDDILMAVIYLHSKNIVHGDIRPENIYIKNGVIKIGDFGNARQIYDENEFSLQETLDIQALGKIMVQLLLKIKSDRCVTDVCKAIINGFYKKVEVAHHKIKVVCNGGTYVLYNWLFETLKDMLTTDGNKCCISAEQIHARFLKFANVDEED